MKKVLKGIVTFVVIIFAIIGAATVGFVGYSYHVANEIVNQLSDEDWNEIFENIETERIIVENIDTWDNY